MNRYQTRALPPAPEGMFAVVMCAQCHVFGLNSEMVIVYDREQHTAAVLCERCAEQSSVVRRWQRVMRDV